MNLQERFDLNIQKIVLTKGVPTVEFMMSDNQTICRKLSIKLYYEQGNVHLYAEKLESAGLFHEVMEYLNDLAIDEVNLVTQS